MFHKIVSTDIAKSTEVDMEKNTEHTIPQFASDDETEEEVRHTEKSPDESSNNKMNENIPIQQNLEETEFTSNETLGASDSESFSSDTPLLHGECVDNDTDITEHTAEIKGMNKVNEAICDSTEGERFETDLFLDMDQISTSVLEKTDEHPFGSGASISYSQVRDIERIKINPIQVFGSGWEFGSVCSINLHGSGDVFRSRTNMDEIHGLNKTSSSGQDRLLSRIFKDKIGSLGFDKSKDKDVFKLSSTEVKDIPLGISFPMKTRNLKNLLILSTSITVLHIAVFGLRNLQSSINSKNGLGVYSLATLCGAFMMGSLASPFIVRRYRPKICLSISCFGHLIYVIANYFPSFYIIIPASIVHGLSNALLWNALCTYITEIGLDESIVKNKPSCNVLSRYFGIFFLALQMSMVLGNLISSLILSQSHTRTRIDQNDVDSTDSILSSATSAYGFLSNSSSVTISQVGVNISTPRAKCGASHCDVANNNKAEPAVDDLDKVFLLGTYSSCAIISIIVVQCFLDQLPNYTPFKSTFKDVAKQAGSVVAMVIDRRFCFIVMLCLYTVFSNGFVVADVLKAFVTCPLGVKMVGYSMICFGLCGSVSSYMFGKLAKCTGNMAAFLTAAVLNLTSLALMASWEPTSEDQYLLFAFIGAWGFADGIWQSQINSLISSMFADRYETAFGCCRVLQGLAGIIVFTMSNTLCIMSKIIFTAATCLLSVILYIVMEITAKKIRIPYTDEEISVQ